MQTSTSWDVWKRTCLQEVTLVVPTVSSVSSNPDVGEGALRTAAQRLRERYRELLRLEIAQTVRDPADIDDEIAELFAAVRAPPRIHPESP